MKTNKDARVLVVDDEANEREGLATLLRGWGYETDTAAHGREALEKIPYFDPVVVICDLRMPEVGGMDLLRQIRHSQPSPSFIMLSGQGTIEEAVEATKLGAFNFLEKPLDVKKLQVELRNCLERRMNERALEIA
ncbi:MAG: response regulator, partial [Terriglobia bacterium]